MKVKIKMKSRSHKYDINRPKSRNAQKYSKERKRCYYDDAYMY